MPIRLDGTPPLPPTPVDGARGQSHSGAAQQVPPFVRGLVNHGNQEIRGFERSVLALVKDIQAGDFLSALSKLLALKRGYSVPAIVERGLVSATAALLKRPWGAGADKLADNLFEGGKNVNKPIEGQMPLRLAAAEKNGDAVRYLMRHNAALLQPQSHKS